MATKKKKKKDKKETRIVSEQIIVTAVVTAYVITYCGRATGSVCVFRPYANGGSASLQAFISLLR
jgi:hypothetical protein